MGQKTTVTLVDDTNGAEAAETVLFGLDGVDYEIDLEDVNAKKLREGLAEFVAKARRTGRSGGRSRAASPARSASSGGGGGRRLEDRERNQKVREWARGQGMTLAERGRIPNEVNEAYDRAHPSS